MSHRWKIGKMSLVLLMSTVIFAVSQASAALSLRTAFNVTETYTDNLFFQNEETEEDFGTFFGPDITLLFENPDIVIGATYFGRVQTFVNNFDESRYTQNADIILELPFLTKQYRGLSVTVQEDMNFSPQLDAFSLSEAQNTAALQGVNPNFSGGGVSGGNTGSGAGTGAGGTGAGGIGAGGTGAGGTGAVGTGGGGTGPGGTGGFGSGIGGADAFGGTGGTQGVFTSRASAFVNRAGITLAYALSPRLDPELRYENQYRHFFSGGFQDSLTHTGIFALPYKLTEFTIVTPSYFYRQTDFLGKSTDTTSGDRIISHNTELSLSHSFTSSLFVTISGGVSFVKQEGATEQVFVAGGMMQERTISNKFVARPTVSGMITKTFSRGTLNLTVSQAVGSGGGLAAQATRTRTATGQGRYSLTRLMTMFASAGWGENVSIDGDAFDTTTYSVQTGLSYLFSRWLSGNLAYSRTDQRSKGTVATDLVVNQVFLGFTAIADPWFLIR